MPKDILIQKSWTYPRTTECLARMRDELVASMAPLGLKDDFLYRLKFCADEAASNIVEHGGELANNPTFEIELTVQSSKATVILKDQCPLFNPTQAPDIDIKRHITKGSKGGLGLEFLKKLLDEFSHQFIDNRNVLTLVFNIRDQHRI